MPTNFLIHFLDKGAVFFHLSAAKVWIEIGRLGENDSWDGLSFDVIRRRAVRLGNGVVTTTLMISSDSVSYLILTQHEPDAALTARDIRQHLALMSGQNESHHAYDHEIDEDLIKIAFVDSQYLDRLEKFVTEFGFPVVAHAADLKSLDDFPRRPFFGLSQLAQERGIDAHHIRDSLALPICPSEATDRRVETNRRQVWRARNAAALLLSVFLSVGLSGPLLTAPTDNISNPLHSTSSPIGADISGVEPADGLHIKAVDGWQSALAPQLGERSVSRPRPGSADWDFDPTSLNYALLDFSATLTPQGHDLWPLTLDQGQSAGHNLLNQADSIVEGIAEGSAPNSSETQTAVENTAHVNPPITAEIGKSVPGDTDFVRPMLRQNARHKTIALDISRPILREGARELEIPDEIALQKQSSEDQEEGIRQAILESLTASVDSSVQVTAAPRRRAESSRNNPTDRLEPTTSEQNAAQTPPRSAMPVPEIDAGAPASGNQLATLEHNFDLGRPQLVGIYGNTSDLRALVRLPNGAFQSLFVGSSFDGGRITQITRSSVFYAKDNRTHQLDLPF